MGNELQAAFEHFKQGNYATAWDLCQYILKTASTQPDCLAMLGMMSNKAERYADAEKYLRKCLFFHPKKHIILTELATSLVYLEKYDEAEKMLNQSMDINSNYEKTYIQLAKLTKQTERKPEAELLLRKLLSINPLSAAAMNNLGTLLVEDNKPNEALPLFKKVIEIDPRMGSAYKNIALIELKNDNKKEALHNFIFALKFFPNDTDSLFNMGNLYASSNKHSKAITFFEKILEKEPENIDVLILAANSFQDLKEFDKAIIYAEKALAIDDTKSTAFYIMARCKTDLFDYEQWNERRENFIKYLEKDLKNPSPINCSTYDPHYYNIPDELQHRLMLRIAEKYKPTTQTKFEFNNRNHKKLRIGYISPDFRHHALGLSVYHIFQHHNHELFETYVFSLGNTGDSDSIQEKIKADANHFHDISNLKINESAQLIYDCEIDILIDFGGYTSHTKPEILTMKPAPVQIFMMGQPDTTGAPQYDYFLSDPILIDETNRKFYTENILYLPHGFICSPVEPSEKLITRKEVGIADDAFVFCSFCSPYKYEPTMFKTWIEILKAVDNSVLWLLGTPGETFRKNIQTFAEQHGVASERIIISGYAPIEEHLNRFKLCDLFLDTLYYSSCSSGSHALMMGVPIVSLCGETNAMRQGASVCHAAGIDETICHTMEEYFNMAVELAKSPEKLRLLKNKLTENQTSIPHFNIKLNVEYMEKGYLKIWEKYTKGEKLNDITID